MRWLAALLAGLVVAASTHASIRAESDDQKSKKVLGSSVATSVSLIADQGNVGGSKTFVSDVNDGVVGTPGGLLAPDRYEFYTFDESGDLVKRLMTLDQIQGLIAGGDSDGMEGDASAPTYYHEVLPDVEPSDLHGVHKVVANVQNVLKSELEANKNKPPIAKPLAVLSAPDAASSWSILLPGVLGGPLESDKTPVPETKLSTVTTEKTTVENPTVIHYLPIQNIPAPPKRNLSSTTTVRFTSTTTMRPTSTSRPNTVPVKIITKPTPNPTVSQSSPLSTESTTSKTVPVVQEMAASLSSVLSQVVDEAGPLGAIESNYVPVGLTVANPPASRPDTTDPSFPTTTSVDNEKTQKPDIVTSIKPYSSSGDSEYTEIKTVKPQNRPQTVPVFVATQIATTEPAIVPFEYDNGDVSDAQLISEALAAQGIVENPSKTETKPMNEARVPTETTVYPTETYPTETEASENTTVVHRTTAKPQSARPKPLVNNSVKTPQSYLKTSPAVDIKKPDTQTSGSEKLSTTETVKYSTTSSKPQSTRTTAKPETTTKIEKRPSLSTTGNKLKTTNKKPLSPTTPSSKPKPISTGTLDQKITSHQNKSAAPQYATVSLNASPESLEFQRVPTVHPGQSLSTDNPFTSTTTHTVSPAKWHTNASGHTPQKTKEDIPVTQPSNYVADGSNEESVSVDPEEDGAGVSTIGPDLDLLREGISAVTGVLLRDNGIQTVPAFTDRFTGGSSRPPVMGELKHASRITSEDNSPTTTVDSTTESIPERTTNDNIFTEISTQTEINSTEDDTVTDYALTTDAETAANTDRTTKVTDEASTALNISAIEFTTSIYEGTTVIQNEKDETLEKKTADYELEAGGQSTQLKESKLSPETSSKGAGISSNSISDETKFERVTEKSVSGPIKNETLKHQSLNFVGNASKNTFDSAEDAKADDIRNGTHNTNVNVTNKPIFKRPDSTASPVELHPAPHENLGLEASTSLLGDDVRRFADLCNELAFRMWTSITGKGSISARSLVLSPFAVTSLLAMVFLGARGPTSGQMNDVLRLDDMITFNPHQVLQNVTESVLDSKNHGVATAAFVRELYSDKAKGKILEFYKERAQQYYDGHVEEINFGSIGDILRRRTNLLIKRQTLGRVPEYLRGSSLSLRHPLAAFSANIFQTDCEKASIEGRDGEMYFVVRPSTRQRRLVPVPAAVWRSGFLAGYEPGLDATAVCLGADSIVSTLFVLPGQQGQIAPGDGLARLEQRLIETSYRRGGWSRLLRSLLVRPGLELQVPRFSHRSVLNVTGALQRMGLKDLFSAGRADLRGLNGLSNDLHLSDIVQINTFSTCAEDTIGARHHTETYPASPQRMGREEHQLFPIYYNDYSQVPLALRPRQARLPDNPRLRFDRPFLYMVRHNPTGMILHMGRFNPRLLP